MKRGTFAIWTNDCLMKSDNFVVGHTIMKAPDPV